MLMYGSGTVVRSLRMRVRDSRISQCIALDRRECREKSEREACQRDL